MKGREFERLVKPHLEEWLPGYSIRGALIFKTPIQGLLRCCIWQTSGFSADRGDLVVFVQPLYIPDGSLALTDGNRFNPPTKTWIADANNPAQFLADLPAALASGKADMHEGLPDLPAYIRFLEAKRARPRAHLNSHLAERLAYTLVIVGRYDEAIPLLQDVVDQTAEDPPKPAWPHVVAARCALMRDLIRQDPALALEQLRQYRRETLAALDLEKWAVPDDLT